MLLNKVLKNKYIFSAEIFIKKCKCYGIFNTVNFYRNKNSLKKIVNLYKDNKSVDMLKLINNKEFINTEFDLGYYVLGPVIYDFVVWLNEQLVGYDKIWFLSREGWLLKSAYEVYSDRHNCEYFLASRRAVSVAAISSAEDIKEILSQYYKGGIKNLFKSRLGLDIKIDDIAVSMPDDIEKVMKYVNLDEIIKNAKSERKNYLNYINGYDKNIVVVDIGYSGTIQYYLSKMLGKKISGLYLCNHFNNKPCKIGCECKSLFPVYNLLDERENIIFKNQLLFESVLTAPYGQLVKFDKFGTPIYNEKIVFNKSIQEIQQGILDFIVDMGKQKSYVPSMLSLEIFRLYVNGNKINKDLLKKLQVEDMYCSDKILNIKTY